MRLAIFSTKPYDRRFLDAANDAAGSPHELIYLEPRLTEATAPLAHEFQGVCAFVNDQVNDKVLETLAAGGTTFVALRSAGFNHVDLEAAQRLGIRVARVPAYSPHAVAEHALALILTLNRQTYRAYNRVREGNFALEGLLGFDLHGKTAGVVGTGKIGVNVCRILNGFGCEVLAYDPFPNDQAKQAGANYVPLDELLERAHIVSLHCPLTPDTHHLINSASIQRMRRGAMLINTSRGGLIDTYAALHGLKSGHLGSLALDVYEEEADLFYEDLSGRIIQDDVFARLLTFPNVLITGHQAFFTKEALTAIAETTIANASAFEAKGELSNEVKAQKHNAARQ